jgi:hypothetical protein
MIGSNEYASDEPDAGVVDSIPVAEEQSPV